MSTNAIYNTHIKGLSIFSFLDRFRAREKLMDGKKVQTLLGRRIRQLRNEQGLTQERAAEKAGTITEKRWSDIERGMYAVGLATLAKIATGLNVPVQELFEFEKTKRQKVKNRFSRKNLLTIDKQIVKMEEEIASLKKRVRGLLKPIK